LTHREEKHHFPKRRILTTFLVLFLTLLSAFIPISSSTISKVDAADLGLPPETYYAGTDTGLRGDDNYSSALNIGFGFTYFGNTYTQFQATTNGLIYFGGGDYYHYSNSAIPSPAEPNNAIYAFWDDLYSYDDTQLVLYRTIGDVGSRELIVQWTNYGYFNSDLPMGTFQIILYEGSNNIRFQYRQLLTASRSYGQSATIGLENAGGTAAVQYSSETESLDPEQSILWTPSSSSYTYDSGAAYEGVYLYNDNPPPNVPELVSPSNGSAGVSATPTFDWNAAIGADIYNLVVSTNSNLSSPIINQTGLTSTSYSGGSLSVGPTYYWGVEAENSYGNTWSSIWSFTTAAGNSAPSDITLSNDSISMGSPSGTTVGTFTTSDPDSGDTHTYTLVDGAGSSDNNSFTISGDTLLSAAILSAGDYTIRVRSADNDGLYLDKIFLIHVTEPNVAPTDISLSPDSVDENSGAGYTIGTFSTTDANSHDSFSYTFVPGTGDNDNSAFSISGSSLIINGNPDYESKSSYSIRVRSTDQGSLYTEKQLTILVNDLDDSLTVTIEQNSAQLDPTRFSPIVFDVSFSEEVVEFTPSDVSLTGSTVPGTLVAAIGGTGPDYEVLVSGMTGSGLVVITIPANSVVDIYNNYNLASTNTDNTVTYDVTPPTVTINQGASQADPTNSEPIVFDVVFSEDVIGFTNDDVTITGMTGTPNVTVLGTGSDYSVQVSGAVHGETIVAEISANKAVDLAGNSNDASTSTDNSVSIDTTSIQIMESGIVGYPGGVIIEHDKKYTSKFNRIEIEFDSDAYNPIGNTEEDDVTNPDNYYLIDPGENGEFEITSCPDGQSIEASVLDDVFIPVGPVSYDNNGGNGPFISTLTVNNGVNLPLGTYRLLLCGSTTIMDLAENPLNGGEDVSIDFTIYKLPEELPLTGFNQGQVTVLPKQEKASSYSSAGMVLSLPKLGVSAQIVGVQLENDGWNTTWLGNDAGYLEGSAFPTWEGNTVITGHIWTSTNKPGIFLNLNTLQYGDEVKIYSWGQVYTYQVRSNYLISNTNVASVMRSMTSDWLTLLTCDGYDPETGTYSYRRVVRAVLISVE